MNFNSIRSKVTLLFVPLIVLPLLIGGIIGAFYFQDVLKHNIWEDNLAQARGLSVYVDNYVSSSANYLRSLATRPVLVQEMAGIPGNDTSVIDETVRFGATNSQFYAVYVTDPSGKVVSGYPEASHIGRNYSDEPYVTDVLSTARSRVMGPLANRTGNSTVFISTPIIGKDGKLLGVMVGELDPDTIGDQILYVQEKNRQYIYMVDEAGNVVVHTNRSYMDSMADFSRVPAVREVMQGKSGVFDQYNPIENDQRLAAYSPVKGLGWGVIVAIPTSIVYQPIANVLWLVVAVTLALIVTSLMIAYAFSKSIVDPIMGLYEAARAITNRREYKQYLPVKRNDEVGQVAVCMDKMARRIDEDREKIRAEKDRAEEEKNRSELYLDIMGHDINNLNQSILANLELIRDEANLTADEKESIEASIASSMGSAALIRNVRKLQQLAEEKKEAEVIDIDDMIQDCIRGSPRPQGQKVTINYTPRKGLRVRCVPLLKEVFCNLVANSIKHSGRDVTIDIETGETTIMDRMYYKVSVSDNGPGIPDEVKPRLFNRFQRGTTKAHGKGLGLYIVKSILEKCDGAAKIEDRVPGDHSKGAKFIVTLPAAEG